MWRKNGQSFNPLLSDIAHRTKTSIANLKQLMEKKQIHLSVDCPENLPVPHDRRWTSEALFNLLDNGVKYTPPGGCLKVAVHVWGGYIKVVSCVGKGSTFSVFLPVK